MAYWPPNTAFSDCRGALGFLSISTRPLISSKLRLVVHVHNTHNKPVATTKSIEERSHAHGKREISAFMVRYMHSIHEDGASEVNGPKDDVRVLEYGLERCCIPHDRMIRSIAYKGLAALIDIRHVYPAIEVMACIPFGSKPFVCVVEFEVPFAVKDKEPIPFEIRTWMLR